MSASPESLPPWPETDIRPLLAEDLRGAPPPTRPDWRVLARAHAAGLEAVGAPEPYASDLRRYADLIRALTRSGEGA